jgi:probable F420-dependent oxidoreductase
VRIGLALPHYDFSVPGERPLRFETVVEYARRAEALGFDSLWVSDHLFLDIEKYGGPPDREFAYEPLVTLAALAGIVRRPRLGTLVLCEVLRPASVLAHALGTLDRLTGGRLDVGLGAGWYEPEYEAVGTAMPPPGVRLDRLREAVEVVQGLVGGGPLTYDGRYHSARGAVSEPGSLQQPRPPVFLGGKGDRLLRLAAECADGWNTCWVWTPDAYGERVAALDRACDEVGRDPASVTRSLGLYALAGENRRDLERRFERMRAGYPGVLGSLTVDAWAAGRLAGTVDEIAEQRAEWDGAGVETLVVGAGPVPFSIGALDDLEPLAAGLIRSGPG